MKSTGIFRAFLCIICCSAITALQAATVMVGNSPVQEAVVQQWESDYTSLQNQLMDQRLKGNLAKKGVLQVKTLDPNALLFESDKSPLDVVVRRTRALIADLEKSPKTPDFRKMKMDLALLESKAAESDRLGKTTQADAAQYDLYVQACALRRSAVLANPAIDFDSLIFLSKYSRYQIFLGLDWGWQLTPGGAIYCLSGLKTSTPKIKDLLLSPKVTNGQFAGKSLSKDGGAFKGAFSSMDLSYDGKTLVFAWSQRPYSDYKEGEGHGNPHGDNSASYNDTTCCHLFSMNIDGTGLKELTTGNHDDFNPYWMPDGRIGFISTRAGGNARCNFRWGLPVPGGACPCGTLYSMKADGSDMTRLSWHETSELQPSVDNDGKIVYTRWDYVDRDWNYHMFWSCYPDGRDPRAWAGNYPEPQNTMAGTSFADKRDLRPFSELFIRAIPGTTGKYALIAAGHHCCNIGGLLVKLDINIPDDNGGAQVTKISPVGNAIYPKDDYSFATNYTSPWPLSENYYIVGEKGAIKLVDIFGNVETLFSIATTGSQGGLQMSATASASSSYSGYPASGVNDGIVGGYPANNNEWASNGEKAGAWVQLQWSSAVTADSIALFDRPCGEQVTGGTLTFSDGTSITVGALDNSAIQGTGFKFTPKSITWVRFTITGVNASTANTGLSEFQVFNGTPPQPLIQDPLWVHYPVPLRSRSKPRVITAGTWAGERKDLTDHYRATLGVVNIKEADFTWPAGTKITALRIIQLAPQPWGLGISDNPVTITNNVGYSQDGIPRLVLGTVPVESDGSAYFEAPVGKEIYFQALDSAGMAVQSMRSGTYVHPGEQLTCSGCHENKWKAIPPPSSVPLAFKRAPSKITPDVAGSAPLSFFRLVKPVFDASCKSCHTTEGKGPDMSYASLKPYAYYVNASNWTSGGFGDAILEPLHGGSRSIAGMVGARAANLTKHLDTTHNGVKLSSTNRHRITLWLDCNSMNFGSYSLTEANSGGATWRWPTWDVDSVNVQGIETSRPVHGAAVAIKALEDKGMVRPSANDGTQLIGTRGNRLVLVNNSAVSVKISVFNVQGRLLARTELGAHGSWDYSRLNMTGGVFIVRASAGKAVQTLRMSGVNSITFSAVMLSPIQ